MFLLRRLPSRLKTRMTASHLIEQPLFGHELIQQFGLHGSGPEASGNDHAESPASFAHHGAQADIVDRALNAVIAGAAIEGDFELAGQITGEILAQKGVGQSLGVGPHVENLIGGNPRPGTNGHIPHGVVAGLAIRQAHVCQQMHQIGYARQRNEMILNILSGGEMPAPSAEFVGDAAQLFHLRNGQQPAGNLAANHLNAGLPLAVNAMLQAKWPELIFGDLPVEKSQRARAEDFDFFADQPVMLDFKLLEIGPGVDSSGAHNDPCGDRD